MKPGTDAHLRDVRAFVAVAEHLYFSRAAEALRISQPALSRQVRGLERLLRVELFVRDRRSVRLTAPGTAVLPGARAALAAWTGAQEDLAEAAAQARTLLVVGISLGVERHLLPEVRAHLARIVPGAELQLRRVTWADQTSGLSPRTGPSVDAAFVWLPLAGAEAYEWVDVASEPRWLVMSARHRLAGVKEIPFGEVVDEPFLALPPSAGPARYFWLGDDARRDRPASVSMDAASTEELVEALTAGVGMCLIAEGNLEAFRREGIAAVPVTGLAPSKLVLAWRRGDDRPVLRALVEATTRAVGGASTAR